MGGSKDCEGQRNGGVSKSMEASDKWQMDISYDCTANNLDNQKVFECTRWNTVGKMLNNGRNYALSLKLLSTKMKKLNADDQT